MNTLDKIKIVDVYGQFNNRGTDHYYIYYSSEDLKRDLRWMGQINDPRELSGTGLTEFYAIWCNNLGWWTSFVRKNPHDPRAGFAMVSVCMGDNRPVNGYEIRNLLSRLSDLLVVRNMHNDDETKKIISESPVQTSSCRNSSFNTSGSSAFISYRDEADLDKKLGNLNQNEYRAYSRIFILPNGFEARIPERIRNINARVNIKNIYTISCEDPAHCKASKLEACEGESITVTYIKDATHKTTKNFIVGKPCPEVEVKGGSFIIKSPDLTNMNYKKQIQIKFTNKQKSAISDLDVSVGGDKLTHTHNGIYEGLVSDDSHGMMNVEINDSPVKVIDRGQKLNINNFVGSRGFQKTSEGIIIDLNQIKGASSNAAGNNPSGGKKSKNSGNFLKWALIISVIFNVLCVIFLLIGSPEEKQTQRKGENTEQSENKGVQDQIPSTNPEEIKAEIEADKAYLKKKDVWESNRLKTQEFKKLISYISSGDVDAILDINPSLFGSPMDRSKVNGIWIGISRSLDRLWKDYNNKGEVKNILIEFSKGGKIDLNEISKNLNLLKDRTKGSDSDEQVQPRKQKQDDNPGQTKVTDTKKGKTKENKQKQTEEKKGHPSSEI